MLKDAYLWSIPEMSCLVVPIATINCNVLMFFTYVVNRCQSLRYCTSLWYGLWNKKASDKVLFWKIWTEHSAVHWKSQSEFFLSGLKQCCGSGSGRIRNILAWRIRIHVYIQPHYNTCFMLPLVKRMLNPGLNDANLSSKECYWFTVR